MRVRDRRVLIFKEREGRKESLIGRKEGFPGKEGLFTRRFKLTKV